MSFTGQRYDFRDQAGDYARLAEELGGLLSGESDFVANAANTAALIFAALPDLNWAGFYFLKRGELVVGPFQGKPACVRIALGKGVCGTAAAERRTLVVPDVNAFPGHIACDGASKSEIVVPLIAVTSPQVKPDADRLGLTRRIEAAGGTLLAGMCFYQSYAREIAEANGWKRLATNSAKMVNILGGYGYQPMLASMEACVDAASAGYLE